MNGEIMKTMARTFFGKGLDRNFDTATEAEKCGAKITFNQGCFDETLATFKDGSGFMFNEKNEVEFTLDYKKWMSRLVLSL